MVKNDKEEWIIKAPKSAAGYRFTPLPVEVIKKLKAVDGDRIVNLNPFQIYKRYKKALKNAGLPDFRFHDLRHYYASVLHAIGVPDKYIMQYGGWSTDSVLKNVYQHVMDDKDKQEQNKVTDFFSDIAKGD